MSPKSVDQDSVDLSSLPSLPGAWVWCIPADVCSVIASGSTPKPNEMYAGAGDVPFIKVYNLTHRGVLDFSVKPTFIDRSIHLGLLARSRVLPDDVLINIVGPPLGKVAIVPSDHPEWNINQAVVVFRPEAGVLNKYLAFAFLTDSIMRRVTSLAKATAGQFNIGVGMCRRLLPLPMAPTNEQHRIVAKIEELFSDLDTGVAALKRAKANLKRYRAAVLKAAVEGQLTAEWRAKHSQTEPASKLLARILKERRQQWEANQLAKFAAAKKEPPKNWREKYVEPTPPVMTGLPELPESWCWASVQQVGSVQLGRQRAPQHHNGPNMRPYLRVANVFEDRIDTSDVMEMNFTPLEFETFRLSFGDILLNEGQSMELIGRPAMYRDEVPGACFTNTLVRFRVYDGVDTNYALKVFLAYLKNGRFQKIATITVNIAHLGAGRFSEIEFPLAPMDEQAAIIEEVDRHFSLIDAAERAITFSLLRAARLRQSILKQAFEGKLVPQDPQDEPASVLLERLRASRGAMVDTQQPRTRRVRRMSKIVNSEE